MLCGFTQNNAETKKNQVQEEDKWNKYQTAWWGKTELDETSASQTSMGIQSSMKQVPNRAWCGTELNETSARQSLMGVHSVSCG